MQACIDHARDLLEAAKLVQSSGRPNIAYHLATLALEEVGRRELIGLETIANATSDVPPSWPEKHAHNHVRKLFWAFFGGMFRSAKITMETFEENKGFARQIHDRRLEGLYVDTSGGQSVPSDAIPEEEAANLIALVEARLGMAATDLPSAHVSREIIDIQNWFLATADDEEKRKLIFSDVSMGKLAEFGGETRAWIEWLKGEFDAAEATARDILKRELEKTDATTGAEGNPKWRIRFRLYSDAMAVNPKELNWWNNGVRWIKILPVPDSKHKREIIVELNLNDNIAIGQLWNAGSAYVRMFVAALNLGSRAFWWFHLPRQTSRFYEAIEDIENGGQVRLERAGTKIEWGSRLVLDHAILRQTMYQMSVVLKLFGTATWQMVDFYLGGLTFLSLNEVHWPCEIQSYGNFHSCIRLAMQAYGGWDGSEPFDDAFIRLLEELAPEMPAEQVERFRSICKAYEANAPETANVAVNECAFAKVICDSYFARSVAPVVLKDMEPVVVTEESPAAAADSKSPLSPPSPSSPPPGELRER